MTASYGFVQLDVFTRTPLAGNPLAVFTDARGLTDKQMQALAREMNLSETTFILPREPDLEATNGKRVRIFTTREELPFAGHPTLGTALYLYSTTNTAPDEIVLDLNVGKIPVRFTADSTRARNNRAEGDVFGEMRQRDPESLRRFASSLGHLEKYHETVTLFWVHFLARERAMFTGKSLEQIAKANRRLLEKDFPLTYYSRQLLFSDRARESWVEPDLKSFSQAVDTDQHSGSASEKEL
jgi:predicted PhzF superfamily epimerase YddE/YHI9